MTWKKKKNSGGIFCLEMENALIFATPNRT
jgi:hypothetical protein